jgi:hypothetical protein
MNKTVTQNKIFMNKRKLAITPRTIEGKKFSMIIF